MYKFKTFNSSNLVGGLVADFLNEQQIKREDIISIEFWRTNEGGYSASLIYIES